MHAPLPGPPQAYKCGSRGWRVICKEAFRAWAGCLKDMRAWWKAQRQPAVAQASTVFSGVAAGAPRPAAPAGAQALRGLGLAGAGRGRRLSAAGATVAAAVSRRRA